MTGISASTPKFYRCHKPISNFVRADATPMWHLLKNWSKIYSFTKDYTRESMFMTSNQIRMNPPPYVSFSTFRTLREWLREEGIPIRFDRSFWETKFSGSNGRQLVSAMNFLGLLAGENPTQLLEEFVNATNDEWRSLLAKSIKENYAIVPFDELDRATPSMIRQWFKAYPVDGHTLRKAISFFINAAKESRIPLSNSVTKMARSRYASNPSLSTGKRIEEQISPLEDGHDIAPIEINHIKKPSIKKDNNHPNKTTINLESGGSVNFDMAIDLFSLSEKDRKFILGIIDMVNNYRGNGLESNSDALPSDE